MLVKVEKLKFYLENEYNVLFTGHAGVGKSSIVLKLFEEAKLKWAYFSAATMDPWVDFIGVPREVKEGDKYYLDLVRPKQFAEDDIEAIFMDEFNRASKKVRNAVMELIQFKSINGKKFNNLKVIWAAINPTSADNLKYDVEDLDPAQIDRFQIHINIPYELELDYFNKKYGQQQTKAAHEWWQQLSQEARHLVSPRRLDYALDVFNKDGDIRDVLPHVTDISKLVSVLNHGAIKPRLENLFNQKNVEETKKFLVNPNNYDAAIPLILNKNEYKNFFLPCVPLERLTALITENYHVVKHVAANYYLEDSFRDAIDSMTLDSKIKFQIAKEIDLAVPDPSTLDFMTLTGKNITKGSELHTASNTQYEIPDFIGSDTPERAANLTNLYKCIAVNPTPEDAEKILKLLEGYCASSQNKTILSRATEFVSLFNLALRATMTDNVQESYEAIFKKKKRLYAKLYGCKLLPHCINDKNQW